jgi:hypothetical protein
MIFHMVSIRQVSLPEFCKHLSSFACVLHTLPLSSNILTVGEENKRQRSSECISLDFLLSLSPKSDYSPQQFLLNFSNLISPPFRGFSLRANYTDRATAAFSTKLVPTLADRMAHGSPRPYFLFSRPEPLHFL